jgi:hypothetical protein
LPENSGEDGDIWIAANLTEVVVTLLQMAYLLIAFSYVVAAVALYAGH